jgi:hypothetical protein
MSELLECARCGGLKREDTRCCPHCGCHAPPWRRWTARILTAVGLSVTQCSAPIAVPYGLVLTPTGGRAPGTSSSGGSTGGSSTGGGSSGGFTAADAYGIAPLRDAGPDAGDGGHDGGADGGHGDENG